MSGTVKKCPFAWEEDKAWSFPEIWAALGRHHPRAHPVSYFMIAVVFFEETGFCNIRQAHTKGNLGIGFGQLEVSNPEKREFYAWMGLPTDYRQVAERMLADRDFSVGVHCGKYQYLHEVKKRGLEGILGARVGPHKAYKLLFRQGESMLHKAFDAGDRKGYIAALNHARTSSPKANGIGEKYFPEYWRFTPPDSWLTLGV